MEAVKKQALTTFKTRLSFEENLSKLALAMSKLTTKDVNFDRALLHNPVQKTASGLQAPVTYIGIQENEFFSLSMFVLRSGSRLPLHDHPMMHGLCKVIHGRIRLQNYSILDDPLLHFEEPEVPVRKGSERIIGPNDDTVILTPQEGNIHELVAVEGPAVFIDILAPPYLSDIPGFGPRSCHYYSHLVSTDGETGKLVKLDRPPDYWTDEAPYLGTI